MDPIETMSEYVQVPRAKFARAMMMISQQHELIRQQQVKLKATDNLFKLLQSKEDEVRRCKETEKRLMTALHGVQESSQEPMTEKFHIQASVKLSSSRKVLETDSGHLCDGGVDDCELMMPSKFDKLPVSNTSFKRDWPSTAPVLDQPYASMLNKIPAASMNVAPTNTKTVAPTNTNSRTASAVQPVLTFSPDLVDKLMRHNGRLKMAIRDILAQKGLTVSDYLEKREYEDTIKKLQQDVKLLENQITHLTAILSARESGEMDKLAERCVALTNTVSLLERKLFQQEVQDAHPKKTQHKSSSSAVPVEEEEPVLNSSYSQQLVAELKSRVAALDVECTQQRKRLQAVGVENIELRRQNQELKMCKKTDDEQLASLRLENDKLSKAYKCLEAEKRISYNREETNNESEEKVEQKEYYEKLLLQHQEWIQKLAKEAQLLRTSLEAEKAEKNKLKSQLLPRYESTTSSCALQASSHQRSYSLLEVGVVADGEAMPDSENSKKHEEQDELVCSRCLRKFTDNDR